MFAHGARTPVLRRPSDIGLQYVGNGGKESQCGWCKDRWGLSWQITPRALTEALAAGGGEATRAFEAMMPMNKINIATIEAARRGMMWIPRVSDRSKTHRLKSARRSNKGGIWTLILVNTSDDIKKFLHAYSPMRSAGWELLRR
jgi:hypothetical protein